MKLLDFLNRVIYKGKMPASFNEDQQNLFASTVGSLSKTAEEIKRIEEQMDEYNNKLIASREKVKKAKTKIERTEALKEVEVSARKVAEAEAKYAKLDKSFTKLLDKFAKKFNLSGDQVEHVARTIRNNSAELAKTAENADKAFGALKKTAKSGFDSILGDTSAFFVELGVIGELVAASLEQMQGLRNRLVDFNRSMSLGFSNKMIGMDLYGNSANGSLRTMTATNNVSEESFLQSFSGIAKGNAMGNTNKFDEQQAQMQRFGVAAAQLSKFYGVEMGTVNNITSNLVYNFGAKIKDLNEVFKHGKETAAAAGVSVKEYFKNLEEASSQVGRHYIAGGIEGLEKLSAYATKTNQSVNAILNMSDKFKDYTTLYTQQNLAAAHGMTETAANTNKVWSYRRMGRTQEMDQLYKGSLAKDLINNGLVDKKNNIDQSGTLMLQNMNLSPEDIQAVQKMIKLQKEVGVSLEQYLDKENQSIEVRRKIAKFEEQNVKTGEKLSMLWAKIKGAILDPIAQVLAPIVDGTINALSLLTSIVGPIIKALMWPLKQFGQFLGWVGDKLEDFYYFIKPAVDGVGKFGDKLKELWASTNPLIVAFKYIAKTIAAVAGGMMAWWAVQKMRSGIGAVGNLFGGGGWGSMRNLFTRGGIRGMWNVGRGAVTSGVSRAGAWLNAARFNTGVGLAHAGNLINRIPGVSALRGAAGTGLGRTLMNGVKGGLIGSAISGVGNFIGKKAGGKEGETVSTVTNYAGVGAMIGSMIPGIGTAIGALIGGGVGLVRASWSKISDVWADGNKNVLQKLGGTFEAVFATTSEFFTGLWKGIKNMFNSVVNWFTGEEDKKENKENQRAVAGMFTSFSDPRAEIDAIMKKRQAAWAPHIQSAERAYEQRRIEQSKPNVHVEVHTNPMGREAITRVSNKGA